MVVIYILTCQRFCFRPHRRWYTDDPRTDPWESRHHHTESSFRSNASTSRQTDHHSPETRASHQPATDCYTCENHTRHDCCFCKLSLVLYRIGSVIYYSIGCVIFHVIGSVIYHSIGCVIFHVIGSVILFSMGSVILFSMGSVILFSIGSVILFSIGFVILFSIGSVILFSVGSCFVFDL